MTATAAILAATRSTVVGVCVVRKELTGYEGSGRDKNSVVAERCLLVRTIIQRPVLVLALVVTVTIQVALGGHGLV